MRRGSTLGRRLGYRMLVWSGNRLSRTIGRRWPRLRRCGCHLLLIHKGLLLVCSKRPRRLHTGVEPAVCCVEIVSARYVCDHMKRQFLLTLGCSPNRLSNWRASLRHPRHHCRLTNIHRGPWEGQGRGLWLSTLPGRCPTESKDHSKDRTR